MVRKAVKTNDCNKYKRLFITDLIFLTVQKIHQTNVDQKLQDNYLFRIYKHNYQNLFL